MNLDKFLSSKTGKRVLIITFFCILVSLTIFIVIVFMPPPADGFVTYETDPISGVVIRHSRQDPETLLNPDAMLLLGFGVFGERGFTMQHQDIIVTTIRNFFTTNYPSFERLSYRKNSFVYDDTAPTVSYFDLVSNTGETFRIKLNTQNLFEIIVTIYDENNKQLN